MTTLYFTCIATENDTETKIAIEKVVYLSPEVDQSQSDWSIFFVNSYIFYLFICWKHLDITLKITTVNEIFQTRTKKGEGVNKTGTSWYRLNNHVLKKCSINIHFWFIYHWFIIYRPNGFFKVKNKTK